MTDKDLEDVKDGKKFYIEDRLYHRIFSELPVLARQLKSTKTCIISNTQVTNDIFKE